MHLRRQSLLPTLNPARKTGPPSTRATGLVAAAWKVDQMLVLTRRPEEKIVIADQITITIVKVQGKTVRLGIEAPGEIPIHRDEVHQRIQSDAQRALHETAR